MSTARHDSGPRMECAIDHDARTVNIRMWKALDLAPTPISFPFTFFKDVAAEIQAEEVTREKIGYHWTPPAAPIDKPRLLLG